MSANIDIELKSIANELENMGMYVEAEQVDGIIKTAGFSDYITAVKNLFQVMKYSSSIKQHFSNLDEIKTMTDVQQLTNIKDECVKLLKSAANAIVDILQIVAQLVTADLDMPLDMMINVVQSVAVGEAINQQTVGAFLGAIKHLPDVSRIPKIAKMVMRIIPGANMVATVSDLQQVATVFIEADKRLLALQSGGQASETPEQTALQPVQTELPKAANVE